MKIKYNYRVISTNYDVRTMEVRYSSEGYNDIVVGMPLPREGETDIDVISKYAPIEWWKSQSTPLVRVQIGLSGEMTHEPIVNEVVNKIPFPSPVAS